MNEIRVNEGKANIKTFEGKLTKDDPVFFNPRMKFNRDFSVACLARFASGRENEIAVLDLLSGSGIRGIRYALEVPKVSLSVMNDANPRAVEAIKENVRDNVVEESTAIERMGANLLLSLNENKFDFIDVDPFGSPAEFIDGVARAVRHDGALGITATDLGPLAGTYPKTCMRRYSARPLKTDIMHETGVRILTGFIIRSLARYDKAFLPLACFADMHYYRIFGKVIRKRSECDRMMKSIGYLLYCPSCGERMFSSSNSGKCGCGHEFDSVGPLYMGRIFDPEFVSGLESEDDKVRKFIRAIRDEAELSDMMLYDIHQISKREGIENIRTSELVERITAAGFSASASYYSGHHVRTDAPFSEIAKLMRESR